MSKLIQGIGSGATIFTLSEKVITDYSLDIFGYHFKSGTQKDWLDAYNAAISERRWIVFPTWAPQYLNKTGDLRALSDPMVILGNTNQGTLVAPRDRFQSLPERTKKVLSRIELGLDGVTQMDWLVNVEKKSPREAARIWMFQNKKHIENWFKD